MKRTQGSRDLRLRPPAPVYDLEAARRRRELDDEPPPAAPAAAVAS